MSTWQILKSDGTVLTSSTDSTISYNFPANFSSNDINYTIKVTSDTACVSETTYTVPKPDGTIYFSTSHLIDYVSNENTERLKTEACKKMSMDKIDIDISFSSMYKLKGRINLGAFLSIVHNNPINYDDFMGIYRDNPYEFCEGFFMPSLGGESYNAENEFYFDLLKTTYNFDMPTPKITFDEERYENNTIIHDTTGYTTTVYPDGLTFEFKIRDETIMFDFSDRNVPKIIFNYEIPNTVTSYISRRIIIDIPVYVSKDSKHCTDVSNCCPGTHFKILNIHLSLNWDI